jgi:hypothetical protein
MSTAHFIAHADLVAAIPLTRVRRPTFMGPPAARGTNFPDTNSPHR